MDMFSEGATSSMRNGVSKDSKPPNSEGDHVSKVSFHDKVLGSKQSPPLREKVDLLHVKLAYMEYVGGDRMKPMLHLADSVI